MSLKIIRGRAGSGKSTYMIEDMKKNPNCIYIVPEQFSFTAEKKLTESFGVCGLGNPQAISFNRLAGTLFSIYGAPPFITDKASCEMLISYCSNSIDPDGLRLFDGLVRKNEISSTASTLITTFKKYGVTPEMLKKAAETCDDELLKKKLYDSVVIYERYIEGLKNAGVSDLNDTLSVAASIIADDECKYFENKSVYIDQFTDFDPTEYECIKMILKKSKKVCVALCFDDSSHFETVRRTYNRLISLAKSVGVVIEDDKILYDSMLGAKPMLRHLEKNYFDSSSGVFAGTDDTLKIFCAKTKNSEIHAVARAISKLVRDEKYRYRDISVVARDLEEYKGVVDSVFPFYDIPIFMDRKTPLSGHSITIFITSILDILINGFTYENVFRYVKSPFSPLVPNESDELENYCLAAGIRPYSWKKPFFIKCGVYKPDNSSFDDADYNLEKINMLRSRVYDPLKRLSDSLNTNAAVSDICKCLFDFFNEITLEDKVRHYAQSLEAMGENLSAMQTMQVYNLLVDIFNDMCAVLGSKQLTLREFRTTVQAGLDAVEIGTIPISADCVTLGSIDRIKGHGARAVFLIGVNSGKFPASPTDSGFFTDEDKKLLLKSGIELPPPVSELAESEQLLVYDAISCGGEILHISYPIADLSGSALLCSEIINRIYSIFPDISYTDDIVSLPDDESIITTKKAVFDILASKLRDHYITKKPLSPALKSAAYFFSQDEEYAPLLQRAIQMTSYTNASVDVDAKILAKLNQDDMKTSVSRLETYNKCPFSFFAKYLLHLEPRKKFEIKTSDSGSFLHDFLDRFSEFIASSYDENGNLMSWQSIDVSFIKKHTPKILSEVLDRVNSEMLEIPRIKSLFDRLCRVAEQSVYAVKRHITESDFVPLGYEISFDENGKFKPRKLRLPDGKKITLRGRIDRADLCTLVMPDGTSGKFARIVDYKSSEKSLVLSDVYHGVQLQLFVYLSALSESGYNPAGILYCNLSDPIVSVSPSATEEEISQLRVAERRMQGIVVSEYEMFEHMGGKNSLKSVKQISAKNFNSMFKHIDKVIKETASNIYNGKFPINCTKTACDMCDYKVLCRFDTSFDGCTSNDIKKLKDEEIWALIGDEKTDEMD